MAKDAPGDNETVADRLARAVAAQMTGIGSVPREEAERIAAAVTAATRSTTRDDEAVREVLRRMSGAGTDPLGELAARLITVNREQDEASESARKQMAEVAKHLAQQQVTAQQSGDVAQSARISVQQESLEVAKATRDAADAIRKAVLDAIVAAEARNTAANDREKASAKLQTKFLIFAALTCFASFAAAVAAIVSLVNG